MSITCFVGIKDNRRLSRRDQRTILFAASKTARAIQPEAQVTQWLKNADAKYIDLLNVGYFNGVSRLDLL
jgi:hypothetical protein